MEKQETTYYRFLSEVRAFLSKLIKEPIKAEPSKYLKDRDFTKSKLIKDLMSRDILERHEKILDSTNSEEKTAKYVVKYKVKKKDFENKIHKIYIKYFEKNEPEKEKLNEMNANHFPELSKIEKQKKGYANLEGDVIYSFGKNGHGLTDEITKIGKEIEKLSKTNNVFLRDSSFDGCDDLYALSFDTHPISKEDEEVYWPVNKYIEKNLHKLYDKKGDKKTWEDESLIYDKGIEKLKSLGLDDAVKYAKRDKERMRKLRAEQDKGKTCYEIGKEHPELFAINEEGEGGAIGGTSSFSVGADTTRGDIAYDNVLNGEVINRPAYGANRKGKKSPDPTKISGKSITAEKKNPKRIFITEEQYNMIMEMSTGDAGAMGDYTANGLELKTSDGKEDPCAKAGKIKVKMVMDK